MSESLILRLERRRTSGFQALSPVARCLRRTIFGSKPLKPLEIGEFCDWLSQLASVLQDASLHSSQKRVLCRCVDCETWK